MLLSETSGSLAARKNAQMKICMDQCIIYTCIFKHYPSIQCGIMLYIYPGLYFDILPLTSRSPVYLPSSFNSEGKKQKEKPKFKTELLKNYLVYLIFSEIQDRK